MRITNRPPIEGSYGGGHRLWTVNELPFDFFPAYADGGPVAVPLHGWNVSYSSLSPVLSSASAVADDDGKHTLEIFRVVSYSPYVAERHPLNGNKYEDREEGTRAAYEAGVLALMVYVKDEARYGIEVS